MDLKKELTINSIIRTLLFKYFVHNKIVEIWMIENDIDIPLTSVQVIGYEYNADKNDIVATVVYPDVCSDNGIGVDELSVGFDEFQSYVDSRNVETKIK